MKNNKIELKWAFIFAAVILLWMILEKLSGLHEEYIDYHFYLTNLFAIPAILVMVLALKDKNKKFYSGNMTYKQGLISGIIVSLIIALFSPLTQWIVSYIITPEYFPNVIKRSVELGYFKTTLEAEANFNYKTYAINSTIFSLLFGTVTTTIAMVFLRKKSSKN